MGVLGESLKERGFSKTKLELLNMAVSGLFIVLLVWFAYSSLLLEGKCRATLFTGEERVYDPDNPPNFTEQVVYINLSLENCTQETVCHQIWVCNYSWVDDECWTGICV